jgi:YhcH/YjgK/YiaL family protein
MIKRIFSPLCLLALSLSVSNIFAQADPAVTMTKHQVKKWFAAKQWLNGANLKPQSSINKTEFARQYQANKVYWDKAFNFLKEQDLNAIAVGKYPIDGTNVYASVTADPSKDFDKTQWESHRKYIDLQVVIQGDEKMGQANPGSLTITKPYDETKDVANYSGEGKIYSVPSGTFMIFFPSDAHRPNITPGGNKVVKKIVIKVLAAQ